MILGRMGWKFPISPVYMPDVVDGHFLLTWSLVEPGFQCGIHEIDTSKVKLLFYVLLHIWVYLNFFDPFFAFLVHICISFCGQYYCNDSRFDSSPSLLGVGGGAKYLFGSKIEEQICIHSKICRPWLYIINTELLNIFGFLSGPYLRDIFSPCILCMHVLHSIVCELYTFCNSILSIL